MAVDLRPQAKPPLFRSGGGEAWSTAAAYGAVVERSARAAAFMSMRTPSTATSRGGRVEPAAYRTIQFPLGNLTPKSYADGMTTPNPQRRWYQFSLRLLLLLTGFVAVLCSIGIWTNWYFSALLATIVLFSGIARRIVSTPVRNIVVCLGAIPIDGLLDYLYHNCHVSVIGQYNPLFWPVLYLAILWANWNLFGNETGCWLKWLGRILVSAMLLPIYAFIVIIAGLCVFAALGGRIPFG